MGSEKQAGIRACPGETKSPAVEEDRLQRKSKRLLTGAFVLLGVYLAAVLISFSILPALWTPSRPVLMLALILGARCGVGWVFWRTSQLARQELRPPG